MNLFLQVRILIVLCFVVVGSLEARPKIGLALGGGGARGAAHLGVLKVLEKYQIPVDFIAGTSSGALLGSLYAAGYSVLDIQKMLEEIDFEDLLFYDRVPRDKTLYRRKSDRDRYFFGWELGYRDGKFRLPLGLVHGHEFGLFLQNKFSRVSSVKDFDDLPIPFRAIATDVETGTMVILDRGNLTDAIRASTAYPGAFAPVAWENLILIDGGTTNNLPVSVVRQMGADVVIAVNVTSLMVDQSQLSSFIEVLDQVTTIVMKATADQEIKKADIGIVPPLVGEGTFDLLGMKRMAEIGEKGALQISDRLKKLSVSEREYLDWKQTKAQKQKEPTLIRGVQVEGFQRVDKRTVESRLDSKAGDLYSWSRLESDANRIYALGDFERVDLRLQQENGATDVRIRAVEKSWGPHYLRARLTWDGEIQGKQDGNAHFQWRMTRLNSLNAEWLTEIQMGTVLKLKTEYYQPLHYRGIFFIAPQFFVSRIDQDFYTAEKRVAEYEIDSLGGQFDIGMEANRFGELRLGIRKGYLNSEVELGDPTIPSFEVQTSAWILDLKTDLLDDLYFPRRGFYLSSQFYNSLRWLRANDYYRKLSSEAHVYESFNHHTVSLSASMGTSLKTDLPVYDQFMIGGFRSFSGFREEELRGHHYGVARLAYRWGFPMSRTLFWDQICLAVWGEAGNMWTFKRDISFENLRYSGTLALGFDTKLASIFLAYGQSGKEHKQFYISAGRTFGIQQSRN